MNVEEMAEAHNAQTLVLAKDGIDRVLGFVRLAETDRACGLVSGYSLKGEDCGQQVGSVSFLASEVRVAKRRERLLYDLLVARDSK